MTEESDMPMTLQRLILDHKGDRSYASLSRSCNGDPTDKRLQQIVANGIKAFPAPRTISNLAMGLGVSVTDVLLASARSLGLNVSGRHFGAALVLPGVEVLDSPERQILLDMARALSITARARWQSQAFDVITELSSRGLKVTNEVVSVARRPWPAGASSAPVQRVESAPGRGRVVCAPDDMAQHRGGRAGQRRAVDSGGSGARVGSGWVLPDPGR